jgi:urea carboxylase
VTIAQGDDVVLKMTPAPALDALRDIIYVTAQTVADAVGQGEAVDVQIALLHAAEGIEDAIWVEAITPCHESAPAVVGTVVSTRIQSRSGGRIIAVEVPDAVQAEVSVGDIISANTVLVHLQAQAASAEAALADLAKKVAQVQVSGVLSDQRRIAILCAHPAMLDGTATSALSALPMPPADITILQPGIQTTIQDLPGRVGYWAIGVPPSGPMDDLALRLVNQIVGNVIEAAGIEITLGGVTVHCGHETVVALGGARLHATLNGGDLPWWEPIQVPAGGILRLGGVEGLGARTYLAVRGGIEAPLYLGSRSTFTLGGFGGHAGRELRTGDELTIAHAAVTEPRALAKSQQPRYESTWRIGVLYGPHGEPDFFTPTGLQEFFAAEWKVSPQSNRTGIRLIGPKPQWARSDGGEAGLHPSNIHDNAYALGSVDFTGDMPVILGPDGPSLGGFVCPVVVVSAERWKLGQLKAGDRVKFIRLDNQSARAQADHPARPLTTQALATEPAILWQTAATAHGPAVCYRRAGDDNILIEYGALALDLGMRMRVHALQTAVMAWQEAALVDVTPGIRSLQIHYDPLRINEATVLKRLIETEQQVPDANHVIVPSRVVYLPLSWDDPATQKAIDIYNRTVRPDAPWCPSNLEFIRRINGLDSIEDVYRIVFEAEYLVLGLGDVYLGAPVATPVDPRHRLVTTKYNPARTWTPENAVGIGGAYMCIYGMEGPGGYQFVGRTVQVWNAWRTTNEFTPGKPWLLQPFDRIRFYPVSAEELLQLREDFPRGKLQLRIEEGNFSYAEHRQFLNQHASDIEAFTARRQLAFAEERGRWEATSGALP